ncbi:YggS family pyridoxal phosphate enzyme [Leptolyngbya sp. 'hensonii']|uniref:YggS family pyridoxal phosphate-dependent enzyme n=1 Tax=Leptolyngbya sp. 'hensonii' TaxID=1922337 RepID=UPI00094FD289|nr:YggS family pyridoxal phosphate-dependent enzyme [Leptolyngbya sp. 'hensonii']OLP19670.1 YggS family pyridoxal phosphate enzyme [Leptolyngbya sp. 'hensonii']
MSGETIASRIAHIRQSLPAATRLIAVTKQVGVDAMREAYMSGIRDFGESRVQEAEIKQEQLQDLPDLTWHFIGHLQSNKASKALHLFQWIHSVDSLFLAQRLNRIASTISWTPQVCLQVKVLPDPNKSGWSVPDLLQDLPQLAQCSYLAMRGLMTIPPLGLSEAEILAVFQQTRDLAAQIRQELTQYPTPSMPMDQLSMGMSGDYPLAVQAGATMIRLGTRLFGDRQ